MTPGDAGTNDPRGYASGDALRRYALGYDRARPYDAMRADLDALEQESALPDPHMISK